LLLTKSVLAVQPADFAAIENLEIVREFCLAVGAWQEQHKSLLRDLTSIPE